MKLTRDGDTFFVEHESDRDIVSFSALKQRSVVQTWKLYQRILERIEFTVDRRDKIVRGLCETHTFVFLAHEQRIFRIRKDGHSHWECSTTDPLPQNPTADKYFFLHHRVFFLRDWRDILEEILHALVLEIVNRDPPKTNVVIIYFGEDRTLWVVKRRVGDRVMAMEYDKFLQDEPCVIKL